MSGPASAKNTVGTDCEPASSTSDGFAIWELELTIPNAEYDVLRVCVTGAAGNQKEVYP